MNITTKQTEVISKRTGKKTIFEENQYEFCDDLWNYIKEYLLLPKDKFSGYQAFRQNIYVTFIAGAGSMEFQTSKRKRKCSFYDMSKDNKWKRECLQILKQARCLAQDRLEAYIAGNKDLTLKERYGVFTYDELIPKYNLLDNVQVRLEKDAFQEKLKKEIKNQL